MTVEIFGLSVQQFAGVLLITAAVAYTAWQWWQSRPARSPKRLATEVDFNSLLTDLKTMYAAAIAENNRLHAELAAIRKVVGDPLPEPEHKPATRAKK